MAHRPHEEHPQTDRRRFLKQLTLAGGALAVGAAACRNEEEEPASGRRAKGAKFKFRLQTQWDAGTVGHAAFTAFCERMSQVTDSQMEFEALGPGSVCGTFQLFDAVKAGKLDGMNTSPGYWTKQLPVTAFLSSYPLGMDRPDQWETWFYELGGLELARRAYAQHGLYFLAPIQHDLNLIHSRIPIRKLSDFRGKRVRMPGGLVADCFNACGASTVVLPGGDVYPALQKGSIDAADFAGPAVNLALGFGDVAKYIVMGPVTTPCIHQPVDLLELTFNLDRWNALPKRLQTLIATATREYSWTHYTYIQKANIAAWGKYAAKGVQVLRLSTEDIEKFRRIVVPTWFKWARMDPLGREAFASQLDFMRSANVGYIMQDMLVDQNGRKLTL